MKRSERGDRDTLDDLVSTISRTPSQPPAAEADTSEADERALLQAFVANVPELRNAWIKLADANVEHLKLIKRIERRFAVLAALLLLQSLIVLVGIGAAVAFNRDARLEAIDTRETVDRASLALGDFLRAQGATNEAVTKGIQAEATNDPAAEQEAVAAAVDAERETLRARRTVAEPHERVEVDRKLEQVEVRARKIRESAPGAAGAN